MRTLYLCLLTLAASAAVARADSDVGVVVTGDGVIQPQLTAQLNQWLEQHGYQLVAAPLPPDAVTALHDCFVLDDTDCARVLVGKRARSSTVIFANADVSKGERGMRNIKLTIFWFDKGKPARAENQLCDSCTDQSLRISADALMTQLAGDAGLVTLAPDRTCTRVEIDGKPIPSMANGFALAVGSHQVTCVRAHGPVTKAVAIAKGQTAVFDPGVEPTTPLPKIEQPTDEGPAFYTKKSFAIGLTVVGGAALVTGVVLIAASPTDTGKTPTYRSTRPPGIGVAIGGAVVGGLGAYLWVRATHAQSAPAVSIDNHGASVGWAGSF
ncbi:MAG TPA: hypothetical protein VGM88_22445 [Kofleriaceae bacterium]|jgi:hypothetical protein